MEDPRWAQVDARLLENDMTHHERIEHLLTVIARALTRADAVDVAPWKRGGF